jgi:DNA-binding NtrC family response regulator
MRTIETVTDRADGEQGPPPLYVLRVASGGEAGKSLVLDWNQTPSPVVGQSRVCDLTLHDPRVSRRHLSLSPEGHAVRLRDVGSTNGTRVGGVRVIDALLTGGEAIEIGDTSLKLVRAGAMTVPPSSRDHFGRLVGASQAMQRVYALAERLASAPLPILVEGETGTGKALLAEAIHDAGPRVQGPFLVHDASVLSGDQELSHLFGDEGPGMFEMASGGTLVIDEIGELGDAAQARLVAVLERGIVQRVDGRPPIRVDVRLVATSRGDLEKQVQEGSFREELLFRVSGARLTMPPLRERHGDVELLARHFWTSFGGGGELPRTFLLQIQRHEWPGNVRELEHAVARRIALGDELEGAVFNPSGAALRAEDFLEHVLAMRLAMPAARQLVVDEFEKRYVEQAIADHGGNVSRAAAASGLTRRYFHMLRSKQRG